MPVPLLQVELNGENYKLRQGTGVTKRPVVEWALKTSAGSTKRSDRSLAEEWTIEDLLGGHGVEFADPAEDRQRFWESTAYTRIRRQITLPSVQTAETHSTTGVFAPEVIKEYQGDIYFFSSLTTPANSMRRYNVSLSRWEFFCDTHSTWEAMTGTDTHRALSATAVSARVYKGKLYVACGTAYDIYDGTAGTWTKGAASGQDASYWCEFDNKLVLIDSSGNLKSSTDGTTWTANASIGTPTTINCMETFFDRRGEPAIYVGTSHGLFVVDFWAQKPYPFWDMSRSPHANNCKAMAVWGDALMLAVRDNLVRIQPGATSVFTTLGPGGRDAGLVSNKDTGVGYGRQGDIIALIPLTHMLLLQIKGATANDRSSIMSFTGQGFHTEALGAASGTTMTAMGYSAAFSPARLYFAYGTVTQTSLLYIAVPDTTDNPYQFSGFPYAASANLYTPWYDGGMSEVNKGFYSLDIVADLCTATETIIVSYSTNGGASWTQMTDVNGVADVMDTSPHMTLYFAGRAGVSAKSLRLRFALARGGTGTLTPVFRYAVVNYLKRPTRRYGYDFNIDVRATARRGRSSETVLTDLEIAEALVTLATFTYAGNGTSYVMITDIIKAHTLPTHPSGMRTGFVQVRVAEVV